MRGGSLAAIDAVELISSGLAARCNVTVGILADPGIRLRRIMARDGIGAEEAQLRLRAQRPDSYYIENCDVVLFNNGDMAEFENDFWKQIKEREGNG